MTVNRKKKVTRYRGSKTHGGGSKKKRRGAGNRGGRGLAGTGKRADQRKPSIWKNKYFGKAGFTSRKKDPVRQLSLSRLQEILPDLVEAGLAKDDKGTITLDLTKIGFDKLLAKGNFNAKVNVSARAASAGAVRKVEAAGGKIILPKASESAE